MDYNGHYTYLNNRTDLEVVLCILTSNSTGGVGEQKTNKSTQHWKKRKRALIFQYVHVFYDDIDNIYFLIKKPISKLV